MTSEHVEQRNVIQWCNEWAWKGIEELRYIFAIPNGGNRSITTATRLKLEGVKSGVPDLMLPVPMRGYHGLFLEMKRVDKGKMSDTQNEYREFLKDQGYYCSMCRGSDMAIALIIYYLDLEERMDLLGN